MKKKIGQSILFGAGMLFMIGIFCILGSMNYGKRKGDAVLHANGGSMETSKYNLIVESSIKNYQMVGEVLALVGGAGVITFGCILYQDWEE